MAATTEVSQPTKSLGAEIGQRVRANLQTITIVLAWVAILIIFSVLAGLDGKTFLSPQNVSNLFRQMTVTSFLAMGMVFVIVTGNIDLSVGKLAGFVSVVAAYFQATIWYKLIPAQPILAAALGATDQPMVRPRDGRRDHEARHRRADITTTCLEAFKKDGILSHT